MKILGFKYYGGSETVNVSSTCPTGKFKVVVSDPCDWLVYTVKPTSITVATVQNSSYRDRTCNLTVVNDNGDSDSIEVEQEGYRNMLVDMPLYAIIPYTYYINNDYYELPIRIYGGKGTFKTDGDITDRIKQVYGGSDLYNDYIFYVDKETDGTFTFTHSDHDAYIQYCKKNNFPYKEKNMVKQVLVKNIDKETMDGYTVFSYNGKEYINALPPMVVIDETYQTAIDIKYSCFFDRNLNYIDGSEYEVKCGNSWVEAFYDKNEKRICLKASGRNTLSDRKCILTVKNKENRKQVFSTVILQKSKPSKVH